MRKRRDSKLTVSVHFSQQLLKIFESSRTSLRSLRSSVYEVRTSHTASYTKQIIDARAKDIVAVMKPLAPEGMSDDDLEVRATELINLYDMVQSHMKDEKGKA